MICSHPSGEKGTSFCYLTKDLNEQETCLAQLRHLTDADIPLIVKSFEEANWPKPVSTFETYLHEQIMGTRIVWLAFFNEKVAGYGTLTWQSQYQPFADNSIPEIMDLNVLPPYRRHSIASQILDVAEQEAVQKSQVVGIGVGL